MLFKDQSQFLYIKYGLQNAKMLAEQEIALHVHLLRFDFCKH